MRALRSIDAAGWSSGNSQTRALAKTRAGGGTRAAAAPTQTRVAARAPHTACHGMARMRPNECPELRKCTRCMHVSQATATAVTGETIEQLTGRRFSSPAGAAAPAAPRGPAGARSASARGPRRAPARGVDGPTSTRASTPATGRCRWLSPWPAAPNVDATGLSCEVTRSV